MKLLEILQNIDRRIIYLILALSIILPLLFPIGFPVDITQNTQDVYDLVDKLPAGSVVLLSYDWDAASAPELLPQAEALTRHILDKKLKLVAIALWNQGATFADRVHNTVAPEVGAVYGEDYVNLGYRPGQAVVLNSLARDIHATFPEDVARTKTASIPMMKDIRSIEDIDLVISLSAGDPGLRTYIEQIGAQYPVTITGGVTAVSVPGMLPYLQSGDLVGLLAGMSGAAEYENLIDRPGLGLGGMDAQSISHLVIIAFILIGNIAYLAGGRKKK
ncbi:MAG: hypothetical protein ACOX21_08050 [Bacillota bacterium]|nr:hypothetical protein [Bacillota bacterium]HOC06845.1 hypothetical protein [Bacillota bacterium]HPZ22361.1 hypothetical protein [Bacillota bacterium]HQD20257.1 hypothetical protein [Bacillota bacterium]